SRKKKWATRRGKRVAQGGIRWGSRKEDGGGKRQPDAAPRSAPGAARVRRSGEPPAMLLRSCRGQGRGPCRGKQAAGFASLAVASGSGFERPDLMHAACRNPAAARRLSPSACRARLGAPNAAAGGAATDFAGCRDDRGLVKTARRPVPGLTAAC